MTGPSDTPLETVADADAEPEDKPGLGQRFRQLRARWPWLNHLINAVQHYQQRQADMLAASITYFSFLALFPLVLLGVSVAGIVLSGRPELLQELTDQIRQTVPGDFGNQIVDGVNKARENAGTIGIVGLVGLLYAGLAWMAKLRIGMQTLWLGAPLQIMFLKAYLRDFVALVGVGGAIVLSVGVTALANGLTGTLLGLLNLDGLPGVGVLTRVLGILVSIAGTSLIFLWLFIRLPQLHISVRHILPGAIFAATGFEILKLVGAAYISSLTGSPSAAVFGSFIGILVWIYIVSRFMLFSAAWTATLPGVIAERRADLDAAGPPEPVMVGPRVPPLQVRPAGPSTAAVAAGLLGVGAVVGTGASVAARHWWRTGRQGT